MKFIVSTVIFTRHDVSEVIKQNNFLNNYQTMKVF